MSHLERISPSGLPARAEPPKKEAIGRSPPEAGIRQCHAQPASGGIVRASDWHPGWLSLDSLKNP